VIKLEEFSNLKIAKLEKDEIETFCPFLAKHKNKKIKNE
jgi:hypothetical protein